MTQWHPGDELPHPKPSREDAMVVIARKPDGTPDIWCDPEIIDLVTALNAGGLEPQASCSGHGHRPGFIALADGRWLIIADEAQRQTIDAAFPLDINGEPVAPQDLSVRQPGAPWRYHLGARVTKRCGARWTGRVVGFYSTDLTPEGYAVESENEPGSVQIYPAAALTPAPPQVTS